MSDKFSAERVLLALECMALYEDEGNKFATAVYKYCHIARGTCLNPHEDWICDFLVDEARVLGTGTSPAKRREVEAKSAAEVMNDAGIPNMLEGRTLNLRVEK